MRPKGSLIAMALRLVLVFVLMQIGYLYLTPGGDLDGFFESYAHFQAWAAAIVIGRFVDAGSDLDHIFVGHDYLTVAYECGGIDALIIYLAFLIPYSISVRLKAWGIVLGLLFSVVLNVLRIAVLALLSQFDRSIFDFFHTYVFPLLLIAAHLGLFFLVVESEQNRSSSSIPEVPVV